MSRLPRPLFLARAPYRQRRLRDAARLLPILGVLLLVVPLLWGQAEEDAAVSDMALYFFGIWALLIVLAALFAPGLNSGGEGAGEEDD